MAAAELEPFGYPLVLFPPCFPEKSRCAPVLTLVPIDLLKEPDIGIFKRSPEAFLRRLGHFACIMSS